MAIQLGHLQILRDPCLHETTGSLLLLIGLINPDDYSPDDLLFSYRVMFPWQFYVARICQVLRVYQGLIFTARKRSLRRLCFYTCLSFCPQGGWYSPPPPWQAHPHPCRCPRQAHPHPPAGTPPAGTPPGSHTPSRHPPGMHSCVNKTLRLGPQYISIYACQIKSVNLRNIPNVLQNVKER